MDHNLWVGFPWWIIFPIWAIAGGRFAQLRRRRLAREDRRAERRTRDDGLPGSSPARSPQHDADGSGQRQRALSAAGRLLAEHDAVNTRWLAYELDVAKLIDFPMMTDVREPLTVDFLRAKRAADGLRPGSAEALVDDGGMSDYREAVHRYEVAFDVAEREASRVRDAHYSADERRRLGSARQLIRVAVDPAASSNERQVAYTRARRELEGIIVLPGPALAALERRVVLGLPPGSGQDHPADGAA